MNIGNMEKDPLDLKKGGWFSLDPNIKQVRLEEYKSITPEYWDERIKSVIHSLLIVTSPEKWKEEWLKTRDNIIKQGEFLSFPVPLEHLDMTYASMSGEIREQIIPKFQSGMSFKDLMSREFPAARFVLDPYFEANAVNMVSAPPNTWKSWLFFSLAASIAAGSELFDHFKTEQHKVMVVNEEDSFRSVQDRFKLLDITNTSLPIFFHVAQGLKINSSFVENIVEEMKEKETDVLLLDSLRSMHDAEENDSTEMQVILDHLKEIARQEITVIFTHHHRKRHPLDKQQSADSSRGSSAINAAISGHISLDEEKRENGLYLVIHHLKSKVTTKIEPVEIKVSKGDLTGTMTFDYAGTFKSSNKKIETAIKIIIDNLKVGGWMSVNDFVALEIAGDSIIRAALRDLKRSGKAITITRAEAKIKNIEIEGEGRANELLYSWSEGKNNELDVFETELSTPKD